MLHFVILSIQGLTATVYSILYTAVYLKLGAIEEDTDSL